jgi:hypothetical protein
VEHDATAAALLAEETPEERFLTDLQLLQPSCRLADGGRVDFQRDLSR